jgi:hypothetical protein
MMITMNASVRKYQEETKERRDDDQHIIDNFEKIVKRAPRSVLVVFWAGLRHAFHMFLSQTAENVLYAAHPMRENASFFGSDTVEALALAGQSTLLPKLLGPRERASFVHQLPLVALTKYVDGGYRYNPSQLLASNTTGTEHVVVVADWHFLNDTSLGDNLPEADCLSSLGFTQVLVVLENFEYGDKITDSVFDEKQDIRTVLRARAAARIANSPRLRELLEKGDVDMFPNYSALRRKLKSYATLVPVWFTGME